MQWEKKHSEWFLLNSRQVIKGPYDMAFSSFPLIQKSWQICHFCIAYVVKSKIISVKKVPLVGMEPATPRTLRTLVCTLLCLPD